MKRLIRKAEHDIDNREFAILYIDGEVLEAHTHKEAIDNYLASKQKQPLDGTFEDYIWDDLAANGEKVAFLHYAKDYRLNDNGEITNEPTIYFSDAIGVSQEEVINAVKAKYPGISIYDDIEYDIEPAPENDLGISEELYQYTEKLAKLNIAGVAKMKRLIRKEAAVLDLRRKSDPEIKNYLNKEPDPRVINLMNKGLGPNVIDLRGISKIQQFDTLEDYYREMGWVDGPPQ